MMTRRFTALASMAVAGAFGLVRQAQGVSPFPYVEGFEGGVLQGMIRTLTAAKPVLFVECSDAGRETAWRLLSNLGYRCESAVTGRAVTKFEEYRHADFLWVPGKG